MRPELDLLRIMVEWDDCSAQTTQTLLNDQPTLRFVTLTYMV